MEFDILVLTYPGCPLLLLLLPALLQRSYFQEITPG